MKVVDLLAQRQRNWQELETAIATLGKLRGPGRDPEKILRFAELYRAACADLALAQAYRLPPDTVQYLHQLVAGAHNLLYRSERFQVSRWGRILLVDVPRRLFHDVCVRIAFFLFWGVFFICFYLAMVNPEFAEKVVGANQLLMYEEMYSTPIDERDKDLRSMMAGYYIWNNASIGLSCFVMGIFLGVGSAFSLTFNGAMLGTVFGHMTISPHRDNFFEFVTAHGPFELTAIVLAGGAGLRLGWSVVDTGGLSRLASLRRSARQSIEVAGVASVLFILAAFIEGYISPSPIGVSAKTSVAVVCFSLLLVYFFVLGWSPPPRPTVLVDHDLAADDRSADGNSGFAAAAKATPP